MKLYLLLISMFVMSCGSALPNVNSLQGAVGPTGASGISPVIAHTTTCSKLNNVASLMYQYVTVTYSSGDVWIHCSVSGSTYQSSNEYLYLKNSLGSLSCTLTFDPVHNTGGYYTFTTNGSTRQAVFTDAGQVDNGTVISYAANDCI